MSLSSLRRVAFAVALFSIASAGTATTAGQGAAIPANVSSLLATAGFTDTDLALLREGHVITKTEMSPENLEGAVVTAIRIATTQHRTLDYFHQLVSYVDGQVTLGFGTFNRPPSEADVSRLTLDSSELSELRACQPTMCEIRIGTASPAEIAQAVDWTAPDAAERAQSWVRRTITASASAYLARGDASLKMYDPQSAPIDLQAHWRAIFDRSRALPALAPALHRYLSGFPAAAAPPDISEMLYWDREHYTSLKPMIGLTHVVTWQDRSAPGRVVVVQRQILASHYLYGSLATTLIQQDSTGGTSPVSYVVYFNRSRGDLMKGALASGASGLRARLSNLGSSLQRKVGEQLIKDSAERLLTSMKEALER